MGLSRSHHILTAYDVCGVYLVFESGKDLDDSLLSLRGRRHVCVRIFSIINQNARAGGDDEIVNDRETN